MNHTPLVTVGVVTYNSEEFIESTLDSIMNQDYKNIELIISDDCSTDDTVSKCQSWIEKNGSRFVRVKLVTTDKNTGVSGNSNRALREAQGEWYKCFDGDDYLEPYAISRYVSFVQSNPDVCHVAARVDTLNNVKDNREREVFTNVARFYCSNKGSVDNQYFVISKLLFVSCVTYFAKRIVLINIGGFDERIPCLEDYPILINMIKNGQKLYFIDEVMVRYRVRENSLSHSHQRQNCFSKITTKLIIDYKLIYRCENNFGIWRLFHYYSLWLSRSIVKLGNNKDKFICRLLYSLYLLTDPFVLYKRYVVYKFKYLSNIPNI